MNVKYRLSGTELIYLKQYIIRNSHTYTHRLLDETWIIKEEIRTDINVYNIYGLSTSRH